MAIWYKNSILASIVSVLGCGFIVVAIQELSAGELDLFPDFIGIVAMGVALAVLGWFISDRKAKKQAGK